MTWLSINPNSLSQEVKDVAAYLLSNSHEHSIGADEGEYLSSDELADAFNILDPEVTQVSSIYADLYEEDED